MIYEIATIKIDNNKSKEFEAAVAKAAPLFKDAKGCVSMSLEKVVENQGEYNLRVTWETIENHMVDFRNSPEFQQWRALAGPFFIDAPKVIHTEVAAKYF